MNGRDGFPAGPTFMALPDRWHLTRPATPPFAVPEGVFRLHPPVRHPDGSGHVTVIVDGVAVITLMPPPGLTFRTYFNVLASAVVNQMLTVVPPGAAAVLDGDDDLGGRRWTVTWGPPPPAAEEAP